MRFLRTPATDEGVQPLEAMHQALFDQEIESSVDRWRRRAKALRLQCIENGIGADRFMAGPHQFENPAPQRGEAGAVAFALQFGSIDGGADAIVMVMRLCGKLVGIRYHAARPFVVVIPPKDNATGPPW